MCILKTTCISDQHTNFTDSALEKNIYRTISRGPVVLKNGFGISARSCQDLGKSSSRFLSRYCQDFFLARFLPRLYPKILSCEDSCEDSFLPRFLQRFLLRFVVRSYQENSSQVILANFFFNEWHYTNSCQEMLARSWHEFLARYSSKIFGKIVPEFVGLFHFLTVWNPISWLFGAEIVLIQNPGFTSSNHISSSALDFSMVLTELFTS